MKIPESNPGPLLPMPPIRLDKLSDNTVPEGAYNLRVHKADYVAMPKTEGASPYIKTRLIITGPGDGDHVGRYIFANYPIDGKGKYRLRDLLAVTGLEELTSPDQLVNREFAALVGIEQREGYGPKNVIKAHLTGFVA